MCSELHVPLKYCSNKWDDYSCIGHVMMRDGMMQN